MCQQENLLKFPPQDANSKEVISSDRIRVGPVLSLIPTENSKKYMFY